MTDKKSINRRNFIKGSTGVIAGVGLASLQSTAHAQGNDELKIALIGCGGRGTGAVANNLNSCKNTKLVAVADAFESKAKKAAGRWKVSAENTFWGLDAYKKAIATDCDMVILATPPGFRPLHYSAAIAAGKHVFMEKPCCVDASGYRLLEVANKMADQKNLKVGVGLQRRHQAGYIKGIKEIHDGKYGDLICLKAYWNGGGVWVRPRSAGETEMQYQVKNWYYFNWLCGDNICEQHVHNLDVCNWAKGAHPIEANGMGGREVRKGKEYGQIFDHHFIEYTYPDQTKLYSQCRHIRGCWNSVTEYIHGSKGRGGCAVRAGGRNPYDQEHIDLVNAIRSNQKYNEGHYGATSSFTAVFGRMATYSGKVIKWDDAVKMGNDISPGLAAYNWETTPPVVPNAEGYYPVPVPGKYKPMQSKRRRG